MATRCKLFTAAAVRAPLSLSIKTARAMVEQESPKMADFLFMQNARGIAFADGKLTLKGISPVTVRSRIGVVRCECTKAEENNVSVLLTH